MDIKYIRIFAYSFDGIFTWIVITILATETLITQLILKSSWESIMPLLLGTGIVLAIDYYAFKIAWTDFKTLIESDNEESYRLNRFIFLFGCHPSDTKDCLEVVVFTIETMVDDLCVLEDSIDELNRHAPLSNSDKEKLANAIMAYKYSKVRISEAIYISEANGITFKPFYRFLGEINDGIYRNKWVNNYLGISSTRE